MTRPAFIFLETVVALTLLMGGLLGFETIELLMARQERQTVRLLARTRQQYEQRYGDQLTRGADA